MVTKSCCDRRYEPGKQADMTAIVNRLIRQTEGNPTSRKGE